MTLAPPCAACAAPLEFPTRGPVCHACWASLKPLSPPLCRICGDQLASWRSLAPAESLCPGCRERRSSITRGRAAGAYEGALRDIVHALKYEGRRSLARPLAARMRGAAEDLLRDADFVVPVPLHPWRRLRRGFNQAADLARGLGKPVVPALWRVHATRQQMGLGAAARQRNMRDAIRLSPFARPDVRNSIIVLVDDVRTTGATLEVCAAVLLDGGGREVRAVTAAVASAPQEP